MHRAITRYRAQSIWKIRHMYLYRVVNSKKRFIRTLTFMELCCVNYGLFRITYLKTSPKHIRSLHRLAISALPDLPIFIRIFGLKILHCSSLPILHLRCLTSSTQKLPRKFVDHHTFLSRPSSKSGSAASHHFSLAHQFSVEFGSVKREVDVEVYSVKGALWGIHTLEILLQTFARQIRGERYHFFDT